LTWQLASATRAAGLHNARITIEHNNGAAVAFPASFEVPTAQFSNSCLFMLPGTRFLSSNDMLENSHLLLSNNLVRISA